MLVRNMIKTPKYTVIRCESSQGVEKYGAGLFFFVSLAVLPDFWTMQLWYLKINLPGPAHDHSSCSVMGYWALVAWVSSQVQLQLQRDSGLCSGAGQLSLHWPPWYNFQRSPPHPSPSPHPCSLLPSSVSLSIFPSGLRAPWKPVVSLFLPLPLLSGEPRA